MNIFSKYLAWAALGLFAYMPFHIFLSQWLSSFTGGLEAWKIGKDIFTALLVSVMVLTVLWRRKYTRLYLFFVGFSVIYLLLHLILSIATDQPTETGLLATVYNNRLVWYLLIGYSAALLAPSWATPRRFAKVLLILSTIVCLVAFAQWLLPKDVMTHFGYSIERGVKPNFFIDDKPDFPRVFSTIRDPNSLGAFLILPSTMVLLGLIRFWKTQRRQLFIGLELLHALIIILTFSRSALIGTFIAHGLALLFLFRKQLGAFLKRFAVPVLMAVALMLGGIFMLRDHYIVQNVVFHSDESTKLDDPNELRLKLYQKGIDGIQDDPEGRGPGTAGLVSTRLPNGLLTENYYLQIAYEVGLFGFLMFAMFLGVIVKQLWSLRRGLITQALLASLAGVSVVGMLLHVWANEAVAAGWFILAGVVLGATKTRDLSLTSRGAISGRYTKRKV